MEDVARIETINTIVYFTFLVVSCILFIISIVSAIQAPGYLKGDQYIKAVEKSSVGTLSSIVAFICLTVAAVFGERFGNLEMVLLLVYSLVLILQILWYLVMVRSVQRIDKTINDN